MLLFLDVSNVFDSIHRRKIGQIILAYGFPKATVTAIMIDLIKENGFISKKRQADDIPQKL